ncbi:TetR/AcrR family transcriptional regulator [Maricaulis parjimensis]|uniref:TetR/AcrR family transcriptional regulator n=1 Tax=Maricaulis parjimensis TaxID=144023 RepID=UPI00193AB13E|nr:TetR/AcrR family transcriptional regulator [Maricaulis parjimensis]
MKTKPATTRARNAEATRCAILEAARNRFAHNSYDNVGIREIASEAGVDSALISRYFGSKEELFAQVLDSAKKSDLFQGGREGLARRTAEHLIDNHGGDKPLDDLLVLLNSAGSETAGEMVRRSIHERYNEPMAELLGGRDALLRARMFGSALMGLIISSKIHGTRFLGDLPREAMLERLTRLVEEAIAEI